MTEHIVPDNPTVEACFVEAAGNLRAAEKLASSSVATTVDQIVYIADAWTRLGIALDNARGFDPSHPIPIRLVGDEDPQWTHQRPAPLEDIVAPAPRHAHQWNPFASGCQVPGCGISRDEAAARHEYPPKGPPVNEHKWDEDSGFCRSEVCNAHAGDRPVSACPYRREGNEQ